MISKSGGGQPLYDRLWGSGLSAQPATRESSSAPSGDPVLYLSESRRASPPTTGASFLDSLGELNRITAAEFGDPETDARIAQYEMAFRMQTSVPELTDISKEPAQHLRTLRRGCRASPAPSPPTACWPAAWRSAACASSSSTTAIGTTTAICRPDLPKRCKDVDQASAGLILDLKQRGMLDDTLVVWGGEFGRTVYCQGRLTATDYGRDHHGRCFTMWMAGGGMKPGITYGETDDYGYNITKDPVHVHDLQATILHCLGIDHLRLTYKFQGREFRLDATSMGKW